MNLSDYSKEELLKELDSRSEDVDREEIGASLILGTMCNQNGTDVVEAFRKIESPEDLSFMDSARLRARMNSQRNYRYFYFRGNFESLNEIVEKGGPIMTLLKSSKAVKINRM